MNDQHRPTQPDTRQVSYDESLAMAHAINAKTKECYYNSIVGIMGWTYDIPSDSKRYVEGIAVDRHGIAMEHGWIVLEDRIVDPTWVLIHDEDQMKEIRYFPAIEYSTDQLTQAIRDNSSLRRAMRLPLFMYPPKERRVDFCNPHIALAMDSAYRYVFGNEAMDALLDRRETANASAPVPQ